MSTRCNVRIYDRYQTGPQGDTEERLGVVLYHHHDGYPTFMHGKLKRFLDQAYFYLKDAGYPYWWDSERVGAVLIALSIEDYELPIKPFTTVRARDNARPYNGVPTFQPCVNLHGDIEYVWNVVLWGEKSYAITCHTPAGEAVDLPPSE